MLKNFSTRELIFLTLIGAFMFLADWFIAAPITAATGISGTGGLVSTFFWALIAIFGGLVVRKFGSFSLMHLIYGFLTILAPITLLPGIFKIILFGLMGLLTDIIIYAYKYKKFGYYMGMIIGHIFFFIGAYLLYTWLGIPTTSQVKGAYIMVFIIPLLTLFMCGLGVFAGYRIFLKIKNRRIIKNIIS